MNICLPQSEYFRDDGDTGSGSQCVRLCYNYATMETHNTPVNQIPAIEARPTTVMTTSSAFAQDGPFGVWVGVGIVFGVTVVVLAVGAFAIFLIGLIYKTTSFGLLG